MMAGGVRVPHAILMLCVAGLIPARLPAQRWERQVRERLDRAIDAVQTASRVPITKQTGMLNTDESAWMRTTLVEGTSYRIVAVCDDDCTRLQLTLVTPSGSELAKDRNSESLPMLRFTPNRTMSYSVRVVVEGCRWNPCWYGVAVVPQANSASPL